MQGGHAERRRHDRHPVPAGEHATLAFGWPGPGGYACRMDLRDVSASGLSFVLPHELPGLEFGRTLAGAEATLLGRTVRMDLLVMHISPGPEKGGLCGCLVYPASDPDLLTWKAVLEALSAPRAAAGTART